MIRPFDAAWLFVTSTFLLLGCSSEPGHDESSGGSLASGGSGSPSAGGLVQNSGGSFASGGTGAGGDSTPTGGTAAGGAGATGGQATSGGASSGGATGGQNGLGGRSGAATGGMGGAGGDPDSPGGTGSGGALGGAGGVFEAPAAGDLFDEDWLFTRTHSGPAPTAADFDDSGWEEVTLPHTANLEPLVLKSLQWQGDCWYRKHFTVPTQADDSTVYLLFEGAMNVADVWLDGEHLGQHLGGYTPFGYQLPVTADGSAHTVAVRLNNRDNSVTGPKPLAQLDFNLYSGLYRDVRLIVKNPLHITHPVLADKEASGGVFVRTLSASPTAAELWVQVHVQNDAPEARDFQVRFRLRDPNGAIATESTSETAQLQPGADSETVETLEVLAPELWSPRSPRLYSLETEILTGAQVMDTEITRVGIRHIEISAQGFRINGTPIYLRGTNRHQEYPYIGNALSAAAQYRDARRIKEAGFDYVRLSHYPQHPAFYDACDELGIVLMNAIPGWQYFGSDPAFAEGQYENVRRLVRRDRNHPSVVLWEVSLNETSMPSQFITQTNSIAHAEYPGDQMYTCGWEGNYDVFIEARQHGGCTGTTNRPCIVSEYGDWEYYAQNAGLHQEDWADLAPDDANSRQLRWHGEAALLQQATNFQEAHNDNQKTIALGDGLWVMYDYNRGYAPDIESSGCMDIMRLPKFSYYFFQSQRDASEAYSGSRSGPMVFIANYWTPSSDRDVRVFSNAEEVELYLNDALIDRRSPDADFLSSDLAHPPFTFPMPSFQAGTLEAVAFIAGEEVARHSVSTPGEVAALELTVDSSGRPFAVNGKDTVFIRARLVDETGTVVPNAWENVSFGVTGAATLIGDNPFSSDAGIASNLLQSDAASPHASVYAVSVVEVADSYQVFGASTEADAPPEPFELHVTTDGTPATASSPGYSAPLQAASVHAALTVAGQVIASVSSSDPKFRIQGSTAP